MTGGSDRGTVGGTSAVGATPPPPTGDGAVGEVTGDCTVGIAPFPFGSVGLSETSGVLGVGISLSSGLLLEGVGISLLVVAEPSSVGGSRLKVGALVIPDGVGASDDSVEIEGGKTLLGPPIKRRVGSLVAPPSSIGSGVLSSGSPPPPLLPSRAVQLHAAVTAVVATPHPSGYDYDIDTLFLLLLLTFVFR
jgi:hypothetical protein